MKYRKESYNILNLRKKEIYEKLKGKMKFWSQSSVLRKSSEKERSKSNKYYKYHKDYGHHTEHRRELFAFLETLVKEGKLKEYVQKDT